MRKGNEKWVCFLRRLSNNLRKDPHFIYFFDTLSHYVRFLNSFKQYELEWQYFGLNGEKCSIMCFYI